MGLEELVEVQLAAAQVPHDFRRQVEESPLIVVHFLCAGKPVHAEGRQDKNLVGVQDIQLVVHAHVFPAAQVDIQLVIVMAVVLGNLHMLMEAVMGFIALAALLHGHERRIHFI